MSHRIEPRTLKGFIDELPARALAKERCMDLARSVFRRYAFLPIETPALEYSDILLGKLNSDTEVQRQIYRFRDHGDRDVALRFDLTVPLARFAAQHRQTLGMPFKCYHVGNVWRGENPQAGRQREFMQCDIDTVGTTSPVSDGEVIAVVCDLMAALNVDRFGVRLNDRQLMHAALRARGFTGDVVAVLRAMDKLPKQGAEAVTRELTSVGLSSTQVRHVLELCSVHGPATEVLANFGDEADRLRQVVEVALASGADERRLFVDLSIARGLDYYTSTVFETFLHDLPDIGSVCSGGRYDDLAGRYSNEALPGVGASLGLTRLLDAWEQIGLRELSEAIPAEVLVLQFPGEARIAAMIARSLRTAGIPTELFPEARKIGNQLRYAERRGHRVAVLCGPEESSAGVAKLKQLATREETTVPLDALTGEVERLVRSQ